MIALAPADVAAAILDGRINDGFTLAVLTRAHTHGLKVLAADRAR